MKKEENNTGRIISADVIPAMIDGKQGLLFATPEEQEFLTLEQEAVMKCPALNRLTEVKRRFILYNLTKSTGDSMSDIARKTGISRSRAYELAADPEVIEYLPAAAQQISKQTDILGSLALDHLGEQLYSDVIRGRIHSDNITATQLRILEKCKERLGVSPLVSFTRTEESPEGSRTSETVTGASEVLSKLMMRQKETLSCDVEVPGVESVQSGSVDPHDVEAVVCGVLVDE